MMETSQYDCWLKKGIFWSMAVMLAVMPLVFNAYFIDAFNLPKVTLLRVIVLLSLAGWTARVYYGSPPVRRTLLDIPAAVFLVVSVITTLYSVNPFHSFWGQHMYHFDGLAATLSYVILFFVLVNNLDGPDMPRLLLFIVYGAIPVIGYGIFQSLGYEVVHWQTSPSARIWSSFGNPNFLSGYLVMILPLSLSFLITSKGPQKVLMGAILAGGLYCLFFTYSRSGFLGMIVAGIVLILLIGSSRVRKYLLSSLLLLLILLIVAVINNIAARDSEVESLNPRTGWFSSVASALNARFDVSDPNVKARLQFIGVAAQMFTERPVAGFGPDAFSVVWRKYMTKDLSVLTGNRLSNPGYAHSEFLQTLATGGVMGAGAYLFLVAGIFICGLKYLRSSGDNKMLPAAVLSSLAGIIAANQFSFHSPVTAAYLWFFAGYLALGAGTADKQFSIPQKVRETGSVVVFFAVLVVLAVTVKAYVAEHSFPKGLFFESKGRYNTAIAYYKKAIAMNPFEQTYYQNLGKVYISRAEIELNKELKYEFLELASRAYRQHLALIPQDAMSWNGLGIAAMQLADVTGDRKYFADAESSFRAAIGNAPVFLEPYINLGSMLYMTGKKAEALSVYKKALEIDSREPLIYFNLGNMHAQEGDMSRAMSYWQDALDLNPRYEQAKRNIEANSVLKIK